MRSLGEPGPRAFLQLSAQNAPRRREHIGSAAGFDPRPCGSSIDCLIRANVPPPAFGERYEDGINSFVR